MSLLAQILGTYAPGHSIDHGGVTFTFGRCDLLKASELEGAYFKRAREAVYKLKGEVSEEAYERALSRVTEKYTAGAYAFPVGESYRYYLSGGLPELAAVLTGRDPEQCAALVEDRSADVMHVCLCVVTESFPSFKKKILQMEAQGSPEIRAQLTQLAQMLSADPSPSS